jgi:hypothetical protein
VFGLLIGRAGTQAIYTRHYEVKWQSSQGLAIGPLDIGSSESQGVDRYDGIDAERVGAGLVSFGAMLILWGLGGTWSVLRPARMALTRSISSVLCVLSMLLQTVALVCIFPPWKWGVGPVLWIAMPVLGAAVWIAASAGPDILRRQRWWKVIFGLFAIAAISWAAANSGADCWVGLMLAVFAVMSYAAHLVVMRLPVSSMVVEEASAH